MSYLKTGITVGLAGALALSAAVPSMAAVPTAIAAIKNAPSDNTVSVRWWGWHHHHGWWGPAIGLGIGLGLLGAAIATSPYYYGGARRLELSLRVLHGDGKEVRWRPYPHDFMKPIKVRICIDVRKLQELVAKLHGIVGGSY
jgi:hypothetical protein